MNDFKVTRKKITDYQPDPANANRGTLRGTAVIEDSFRQLGAGRSLLADADGVLIAGNKSQEGAINAGIEDVIEIETDGHTVVVVKRNDLHLDKDSRARQLAYADNRANDLSLDWDPDQIQADLDAGVDLDAYFRDYELEALATALEAESLVAESLEVDITPPGEKRNFGNSKIQIKPVLYAADIADFEAALQLTGLMNRAEALLTVCRYYLDHTER